jgi:nicotinamide-nucleotide amidase
MNKNAEIIAVGSELLTPERVDTNSLLVTQQLNALGVEVVVKQVIGDDRAMLSRAIRDALERSDLLFLIGGLGPTEDDVTRDAAAAAVGRKLVLSLEQEAVLLKRFRQLNKPMAENNLRQAYLLEGAEALPNPHGTAPGQYLITARGAMVLLPGPPREMAPMLENEAVPRLKLILPRRCIKTRSFRITGMGESDLDKLISPIYKRYDNPTTTILFAAGDLFVHLRTRCATERECCLLLREVGDPIAELLGERVYTEDANETLEHVVACLLRHAHATLTTAESCTGGLIAARVTELAGSSDYFMGGFVTYTDAQKTQVLGVPQQLIRAHTAVSREVAGAMAERARELSGATYAVSTTGYAGPSGGSECDPVGTVYIGLAGPQGTKVKRISHGGDRHRVRMLATQYALDLLRGELNAREASAAMAARGAARE